MVAIFCFSFLIATLSAQETLQEQYMAAAEKAYEQAHYVEAEKLYLAALNEEVFLPYPATKYDISLMSFFVTWQKLELPASVLSGP